MTAWEIFLAISLWLLQGVLACYLWKEGLNAIKNRNLRVSTRIILFVLGPCGSILWVVSIIICVAFLLLHGLWEWLTE